MLGLVVTDTLYRDHPDLPEGQLAKLRAAVVNMRALADIARTLGLGPHIRLGRGEQTTGGEDKSSILADTLEALIGAVYLSAGTEPAARFVHRLVDPLLSSSARLGAGLDWKTSLQELTAAAVARRAGVRRGRGGPGPREGLPRQRGRRRRRRRAPAPGAARRKPSSRPRRPPGPS